MKAVSFGQTIGTLLFAALVCLGSSANEIHQPGYLSLDRQTDFAVYYTAASLLHNHLGSHLYDEAANGVNPQRREAHAGGIFLDEAKRRGVRKVDLYLYPPFLAEVLGPLTILPIDVAFFIWRLLGFGMIALSAGCLSRLLGMRWLSLCSLVISTGFLCFSPLWQALHYGQITIVSLGLFSLGLLFYQNGWKRTSAMLCAVTALIKLTPLLLLAPMLVWRDWRWIRWFGLVFVAGLAVCSAVEAPGMLSRFFLHVVPAMSGGVLSRENQTVLSAVQMIWCRGHNVAGLVVPRAVFWLGQTGSVLLLAAAIWRILPVGPTLSAERRTVALIGFALLSLCAAPVAWIDTQIFGFLLLVIVWAELLQRRHSWLQMVFVAACTVCMGGSLALKDLPWVRSVTLLQYLPLISCIALTMYALGNVSETSHTEYAIKPEEARPGSTWMDIAS